MNKTGKTNHKENQVYFKGKNAVKSQLQEIVYSDSKTLILDVNHWALSGNAAVKV